PRVHVADDALTRRDGPREGMAEGVPALAVRDGRIEGRRRAEVPPARIGPGVKAVAVVGVDHMTRAATARAIVTGMIVRAEEREYRIEKAGALQTLEDRIRAGERAVAAEAEPVVATLEDAQDVPRLRDLEAWQGHERGE